MKLELSDYQIITKHFCDKTGLHCEFIQDLKTLFLKIDGKLFKAYRFDKEVEKLTPTNELVLSYISLLEAEVNKEVVFNG